MSTLTCLNHPTFYLILQIIISTYGIILIGIEWNDNNQCYGISQHFDWKYYLITTIVILIIYKLYLFILSGRYCKKLLIKPKIGLFFTTFMGNAILILLWLFYGIIDWTFIDKKKCNDHILIGYIIIIISYFIVLGILSIQQCLFGYKQYKTRMEHISYIKNKQNQSEKQNKNQDEDQNNIDDNMDNTEQELKLEEQDDFEQFAIPKDKVKEFVAEYNYFDGLDFSRSNLLDDDDINSTGNIAPGHVVRNISRSPMPAMPTLNELKSDHVHEIDKNLEVPPPLSRKGTGALSKSPSFSNLFMAETKEMSSTMFLNYNKEMDSDDNLICMICLIEFNKHDIIGGLVCHHIFHRDCIHKWLLTNPSCPLCRQDCEKFADVKFL